MEGGAGRNCQVGAALTTHGHGCKSRKGGTVNQNQSGLKEDDPSSPFIQASVPLAPSPPPCLTDQCGPGSLPPQRLHGTGVTHAAGRSRHVHRVDQHCGGYDDALRLAWGNARTCGK